MGISTGVSGGIAARDFACQACGATFRPRTRIQQWATVFIGLMIGGFVLLLAFMAVVEPITDGLVGYLFALPWLLVGGPLTYWALREFAGPWRHPVRPHAEVPEVRYRNTEPLRMCTCGEIAMCVKIVENTHNGLPTGTDMDYRCTVCDKTFHIEDVLGMSLSGGVGGAFLVLGLGMLSAGFDDWQDAACVGAILLLGAVVSAAPVFRLYDRYLHPVVYQGAGVGGKGVE